MSTIPWLSLLTATGETFYMVIMATVIAIMLGLPLGTWLFIVTIVKPHPLTARFLSGIINIARSIPFIILLVALIPFTRFIIGTSIGINAAIVPLSLGAAPLFARQTFNAYQTLPKGLIDAGFSIGATSYQMIRHILLPEARAPLIQSVTLTMITLVNYSAMAGTVGGGGLGDLAIRYGYQRFDIGTMVLTIIVLISMVQLFQIIGDHLAARWQQLH